MNDWNLSPLMIYPGTPPGASRCVVEAALRRQPMGFDLHFMLKNARDGVVIPAATLPQRRDGLWQYTCAEVFLAPVDGCEYMEFNASPSGEWALYHFADYRAPAPTLTAEMPLIQVEWDGADLHVSAQLEMSDWPLPWLRGELRAGLSAVLELADGTRVYHALAHPRDVPDFHDARGWCAGLAAVDRGQQT